ncbi:MAG: zinc ribbon domain-containing protein [Chloroflexi bacterium]|nr:zinc ribbon domain-containing protein [Chloroflexota bacterium]
MPIYEYRCADCGGYLSVRVRTYADPSDLRCPRCRGGRMRKLVSRFAVLRSEEDRLDRLTDPSTFGDVDENDPRSVARWARRLGREVGEDLGDDFDEMVDRLEAGELADDDAGGDAAVDGADGGGAAGDD